MSPSTNAQMRFGVAACVTTMKRPEALSACLDALDRCVPPPAVIVVSDDSASPEAIDINRRIVAAHPGVVYLSGPRRGVCANRNHALAYARQFQARFVSFIDDDLLLPVNFFGVAAQFYTALHPAERARTVCTGSRDDMASGPVSLTFRGYFAASAAPGSVTVAAAVFPIELFDHELWDENIFFGSEDAELCLRASARGFAIAFVPALHSAHLATGAGVLMNERFGRLTRYELCCEAARLYIGAKRYRTIQPNRWKLAAFLGIYFVHMAVYLARRRSLGSFAHLVRLSNVGRVWARPA